MLMRIRHAATGRTFSFPIGAATPHARTDAAMYDAIRQVRFCGSVCPQQSTPTLLYARAHFYCTACNARGFRRSLARRPLRSLGAVRPASRSQEN